MEKREAEVKVENTKNNINLGSSFYTSSFPLQGSFEYSLSDQVQDKGGGNNSSLGFMELLGLQDYGNYNNPSSILDMVQAPYTTVQLTDPPPPSTPPYTSRTLVPNSNNQPGTPISSSISSASSEALNDESQAKGSGGDEEEEGGGGDEQEDHNKNKKGLRPKKKNQKEHRVAFMTKSEVDHLEDGYRWRKYGQKAVKNSTFPRSYYRCTTASCNVKKRVERSFTDPSIVVTTYEGQHNHQSQVMVRPAFIGSSADHYYSTDGAFAMPMQTRDPLHHQQQHFLNPHKLGGFGYNASAGNARHLYERLLCTPQGSNLLP